MTLGTKGSLAEWFHSTQTAWRRLLKALPAEPPAEPEQQEQCAAKMARRA